MFLLMIWICFICLMTFSKELDQFHYLLFSCFMLYSTNIFNQIYPTQMCFRTAVFLFVLPSIFFWYIAFVYNSFLSLTPLSHKSIISFIFLYAYLVIYLFWECP